MKPKTLNAAYRKGVDALAEAGSIHPHVGTVKLTLCDIDEELGEVPLAALADVTDLDELLAMLREAEVKLLDVQGSYASPRYACNLLSRIDALFAQAIEAGTADTGTGSVHERAVSAGDAS